jgi:hypothetical protein
MKFLKIMFAIIAAVVVLVVVAVVALGAALDSAQKDSDKQAITPAQFRSVKQGTSLHALTDRFGEPTDHQRMKVSGAAKSDCVYYNAKGDFTGQYQFCFDGGKLTSKARY